MKGAPRRWLMACTVVGCFTQVVLSRDVETQPRKRPFLMISPGLIHLPTDAEACPGGQIYDPYMKKCRMLTCAIPGYSVSNGKCVRVSSGSCPEGEKYDPFFKKCRLLACALPGYAISNGKCVKQ